MPTARFADLAEAAAEKFGLVTLDDAKQVGYQPKTIVTLAERGQLERVSRGVYRVPFLPGGEMQAYLAAALWPQGANGVLTHETALDLWDVSDVNPAKIHVTVPHAHRPQREVPRTYVIHREDVDPADVAAIEGVPVVRLARADTPVRSGTPRSGPARASRTARPRPRAAEHRRARPTRPRAWPSELRRARVSTPPKRPKTVNRLQRLITDWEGSSGLPVRRLNLRVASMMLTGALARSIDKDGEPVFLTRGGISMELRAGEKARGTRDVELRAARRPRLSHRAP